MPVVLHIEHRIADLDTWLQDFASRAPAQKQLGVTSVHVFQAEDDPQYIVELVFFDTADAANKYRTFMRERVVIVGAGAGQRSALLHPSRGGGTPLLNLKLDGQRRDAPIWALDPLPPRALSRLSSYLWERR